jgi:oxygen-dependent protoporphyrinogen oxidase
MPPPSGPPRRSVVVVGAGISGLSLAFRLQQAAPWADITVLERGSRPGGVIWTARRDDFQLEESANGFLDNKPSTLALCRDLGLESRLVAASPEAARHRFILLGDRLKRLPAGLADLARTDLLSWRGKLRLLGERWRAPAPGLEEESVDAFARRRAGDEVADVLADAIVTGIYAGDPTLLSAPACFPRLVQYEREFGSVMKGMARAARQRRHEAGDSADTRVRMRSFREGLRLLVETVSERLKRPPEFGVAVRRVERTSTGSWLLAGDGAESRLADAVVLACPAPEQAAILADLDRELAERIAGIPYNRIAVVALGYRREDVPARLDAFGYITPERSRRDLLGVQYCSSIFPDRAPPGFVLLRAMGGGWHRGELVDWDDDRLLAAVRQDLDRALGIAAEPRFHAIVRWPRAIPQYHLGHLERVAWIEARATRHAGLFLGGNAYHGVALNDCTEQAERIAGRVAAFFGGTP